MHSSYHTKTEARHLSLENGCSSRHRGCIKLTDIVEEPNHQQALPAVNWLSPRFIAEEYNPYASKCDDIPLFIMSCSLGKVHYPRNSAMSTFPVLTHRTTQAMNGDAAFSVQRVCDMSFSQPPIIRCLPVFGRVMGMVNLILADVLFTVGQTFNRKFRMSFAAFHNAGDLHSMLFIACSLHTTISK